MKKGGLGEMPLTLWLLVAAVILYLYIRRASLGIDTHPGEGRAVTVKPKQPTVFIGPRQPLPGVGAGPIPFPSGGFMAPGMEPAPNSGGGSLLQ